MEDQAEALRKLMREKKLEKKQHDVEQDKESLRELEKKTQVTDDKVEALAERILNALNHKDTQAEDLFKTVLQRDLQQLAHIEHLDKKLHERLEHRLHDYSQEQAAYIKDLIKEIKKME